MPNASRFRASARALRVDVLPSEPRGDEVVSDSAGAGEADSEGALNGMKETEVRLPMLVPASTDLRDDLEP